MEVSFAEGHIHFLRYDFPGATVHPTGVLTPAQIRDADWNTAPPEIRTTHGETLFIPAEQKSDLEQFCHRNGILKKFRHDTWADLLEPFLDTWFNADQERATDRHLSEAGFTPGEVAEIRRHIARLMLAYNIEGMIWDWVHLGLCDLLDAATGPLVKPSIQAGLGDPATFYTWSMNIAERHR